MRRAHRRFEKSRARTRAILGFALLAIASCGAPPSREMGEEGGALRDRRFDGGAVPPAPVLQEPFDPRSPRLAEAPTGWTAVELLGSGAMSSDGRFVYFSSGSGADIVVFDRAREARIAVYSVDGRSPTCDFPRGEEFSESLVVDLHFDVHAARLWALDARNSRVIEIDPLTGDNLGSIRTSGYPLATHEILFEPATIAPASSLPGAWWPGASLGFAPAMQKAMTRREESADESRTLSVVGAG